MPPDPAAAAFPDFVPVPRACNRHDGWTAERQRRFVELLADYGSVRAAANAVGMTPESAYMLRRHPEGAGFRAAWAAALDHGVARIEDVAMERAINGIEEPVYNYGKLVGTRIRYNDRLLMFILRNRAPARFAAGGPARALNAADKQQLARLKQEWRQEWERERARAADRDEQATYDSIAAKLEAGRARFHDLMSDETRAAYAHFQRCQEADKASGYAHLAQRHGRAREDAQANTAISFMKPGEHLPPPPEPEDDGPRVRTLKDEGWR